MDKAIIEGIVEELNVYFAPTVFTFRYAPNQPDFIITTAKKSLLLVAINKDLITDLKTHLPTEQIIGELFHLVTPEVLKVKIKVNKEIVKLKDYYKALETIKKEIYEDSQEK